MTSSITISKSFDWAFYSITTGFSHPIQYTSSFQVVDIFFFTICIHVNVVYHTDDGSIPGNMITDQMKMIHTKDYCENVQDFLVMGNYIYTLVC